MTTRTDAIQVAGVRKPYGAHEVVAGVDLTVPAGRVYALLGPNGAGKTTTVRILSTLRHADACEVRVAGHDVNHEADLVRVSIGGDSAVLGLIGLLDAALLRGDLVHRGPAAQREQTSGRLPLRTTGQ